MKKRRTVWGRIALIVGLVIALRYVPLLITVYRGWHNKEAFFDGKPTSYWHAELKGRGARFLERGPIGPWLRQKVPFIVPEHPVDMLYKGSRAAVPVLIELLQDNDREVRRSACYILALIGPEAEAAVPALIINLKPFPIGLDDFTQRDPSRNLAVAALGCIGAVAVPPLMEALNDLDVREKAAYALALGRPVPRASIELLKEKDNDAYHTIQTYLWFNRFR